MIAKIFAVGSVAAMLLAGCCDKHCEENAQGKQTALPERTFEPLSLWNAHAPAKDSLEAFVRATTDSNSPDFIPAERRIAVFDWDGTLFMETAPTYFDWMLFEHRRERMVAEAYKGMTLSEFEAYVRAFMQLPQPGYTGLKRSEAYYKPVQAFMATIFGIHQRRKS